MEVYSIPSNFANDIKFRLPGITVVLVHENIRVMNKHAPFAALQEWAQKFVIYPGQLFGFFMAVVKHFKPAPLVWPNWINNT